MAIIIKSPRPPLNIFSKVSKQIDTNANGDWTKIYETPVYRIPGVGPTPTRDVGAVALLTSLIITNPNPATGSPVSVIESSLRFENSNNNTFMIINKLPIPTNDFAKVDLEKQNLPSEESIWIKNEPGQRSEVHLSFVLNQAEEWEEIP